MTATIKTRVARGVALLDEKLPGWDQRIDLDALDIGNACNCILGQTWDEHPDDYDDPYFMHSAWIFGRLDQVRDAGYGFTVDARHQSVREIDAEIADLTAEFKRVILARRAVAA